MSKYFLGKKFLVTAGPVWVPIDKVRVITNIFGGSLGYLIAQKAYEMGADVVLVMGPGRINLPTSKKNFKIIKFKYFDEIFKIIKKEISSKKYDVVIQSAAISDYAPIISKIGKIKSGKKELVIRLKPTIKIIYLIKKIDPSVFLVKFKLEVDVTKTRLINIAHKSMLESNADLIVANDFNTVIKRHKAFIINKDKDCIESEGKEKIAKDMLKIIVSKLK